MLEEDNDKVRRNLVVASAVVILTALIGLPLPQALPFKPVNWQPNPLRLWAAVLVILIYLWLRYRFSDAGESIVHDTVQEYERRVPLLVMPYVLNAFDPAVHSDSRVLSLTWNEACEVFRSQIASKLPPSASYSFAYGGLTFSNVRGTTGTATVGLTAVGSEVNVGGSVPATFNIGGWRGRYYHARSAIAAGIYSRHSIERIAPVVLWVVAMGIAAFRFGRAALELL